MTFLRFFLASASRLKNLIVTLLRTKNNLIPLLYIAILNDYTRYQALPGNAYPEALPP